MIVGASGVGDSPGDVMQLPPPGSDLSTRPYSIHAQRMSVNR